jgi:hypothetical protein
MADKRRAVDRRCVPTVGRIRLGAFRKCLGVRRQSDALINSYRFGEIVVTAAYRSRCLRRDVMRTTWSRRTPSAQYQSASINP